jgi:hypothetical protein
MAIPCLGALIADILGRSVARSSKATSIKSSHAKTLHPARDA